MQALREKRELLRLGRGPTALVSPPHVCHQHALIQERDEEVPGPREVDPVGDAALPVAVFALVPRIEVERKHEFDREPLAEAPLGTPRSARFDFTM